MHKYLSHFSKPKENIVISDDTAVRIYEKRSFSQCGEDLITDYIFQLRGVSHPTYLDIGAYHPWCINNTAIFYLRGCRGVNIEPNPVLYKRFTEERPLDINLSIGIADCEGEMDFYILEDNALGTISSEELNHLLKCGHSLVNKIKTRTIIGILDEYCNGRFPDLLTRDAEGYDLKILKSIEYNRNCPKVICAESADYSKTGSGAKRVDLIN